MITLLVVSGATTWNAIRRLHSDSSVVDHTLEVLLSLRSIETALLHAESGQRKYLITGREEALIPYHQDVDRIQRLIGEFDQLTDDNKEQQDAVAVLGRLTDKRIRELNAVIEQQRTAGSDAARDALLAGVAEHTTDRISEVIQEMRMSESRLLHERERLAEEAYQTGLLTPIISTILGLGSLAAVVYLVEFNRRGARRASLEIGRAQSRLQLALEAAEMGSWNINPETFELLTDSRFRLIFGCEDDQITYEQAFARIHSDDRERVRQAVDVAMDGDNPQSYEAEYRVVHPDGSVRWVLAKGAAQVSRHRNRARVLSFDGTITDFTERKLAADALADLANELAEADRRKSEFLATLAHELRNPLAPIKNAVQLMAMSGLDTETDELRHTIERQVDHLVRLIDDLLDVSRINRGKIALRKEVLDLRSTIDAAVEASITFVEANEQSLNVECPRGEVFIEADPTRVTQVVSNLLNNSSKYSNAGAGIRLSARAEDGMAVIEVEDNGIGLAEEDLANVFGMFTQVNNTLERGTAGLGIGLTLVRTLVELHGGDVTARSEGVGCGSVFTVRLPLAEKPDSATTDEASPESSAESRSYRVLIVEDQRALRMVLSRLLEKMGHEVQSAEGGAEAIELLSGYSPEVIFSDISMPGMTGYDLAKHLRQREDTADTYLVAMTGYGQATDRDLALESGFDEHLIKPVDANRLIELFAALGSPEDSCVP